MVAVVLLGNKTRIDMTHLDDKREIRVAHHIRAIETLLSQEVVLLALRSQCNTVELVLPGQQPAEATIRVLLSTIQTASSAVAGQLGLEST